MDWDGLAGFAQRLFGFDPNSPLLFTQFYFWAFFALVYAVFALIGDRRLLRNAFLFFVSLFFYYKTSGLSVLILVFVTCSDFLIARRIAASGRPGRRKAWLVLSICIDLLLLCYFKYAYFFADFVHSLTGLEMRVVNVFGAVGNALAGTELFRVDRIVLPVGISFFTFQVISYTVDVWGQSVDSDTRVLRLKGGTSGGTQEMIAALGRLKSLERAELRGADIAPAQLCELLPYLPEGETSYDILLFGRRFGSDAEEMDLSGTPMEDTQELEAAIGLMPKLGKVVMCDCGIPDEQMEELREKYAPVSFVWTVHFGVYSLRTDAKSFCGNDLPKYGFVAPPIDDAELEPLKYCTELIALDLGHMKVGDISFLENMPHIKYLILVEESFTDISVIGTLQELEYLELFQNTIDDVSPLLNCRELRHLNLGFSSGFDPEPLKEMTRLKRLWCPGCGFDADTVRAIKQALSDTDCYMPSFDRQGSTGGGWRLDPEYIKMRDAFGMHYQDGRAKK